MGRRKERPKAAREGTSEGIPAELLVSLGEQLGEQRPLLEKAMESPSPVSIRLNPLKGLDLEEERIGWCSNGRYLQERPAFTFDPLLHAGAYYVQEASSMFLEQAIKASGLLEKDILALDLCAAPGGKTTHLRSLLSAGSLLIANEIDRQRQAPLQENLWKWGYPNVIITGSAPADLQGLPEFFDLILVDAPCSGEGMMRKDPFAREQWSPELVQKCALLQRNILQDAWAALAPGGILVYSTCTWETVENELQLKPLIDAGALPLEITLDPAWGMVRTNVHGAIGHRCYPHRVKGEGFFLGMLKKPGELRTRSTEIRKNEQDPLPYLRTGTGLSYTEQQNIQYAVDDSWRPVRDRIRDVLRTLAPGIPVAEKKGAEWRPHAALALNTLLDISTVHAIDLPLDQAILFLRGQALAANGVRGVALATYKGVPLGWLQGAGNRWNNRWPFPWRIRSQAPAAAPVKWANDPIP